MSSNSEKSPPPLAPPTLSPNDKQQLLWIMLFIVFSGIGVALISITAVWFMVSQTGGNALLGTTIASTSLFIMVAQPYYGILVDSINRKRLIISIAMICMSVTLLTALSLGTMIQPVFMTLAVAYAMLYYNFTTPCINSIKQEIFPHNQQRRVTSTIETTLNGTAAVSAILSIFLVQKLDFMETLYVNAGCVTVAGLCFARLQYTPTLTMQNTKTESPFMRIKSGLLYTWERPFFLVHTLISTAPFIVMGTIIFLNPVFLNQIMQAETDSLAITRAFLSTGAFLAGVILRRLLRNMATHRKTYITALGMAFVIYIRTYCDDLISFYFATMAVGFFNAACRECRMNLMHDYIENEYTGRVYTSMQSFLMIARTVVVSGATALLAVLGVENALNITWYIIIPSVVLVIIGMRMTPPETIGGDTDLGSIKENAHGANSVQG